ncbi:hypothetical protein N0A02_00165 [Paraburkholderia acidicola]|uniref:Uncharacterized protein n=1 Tax=Paraburkholderia acidicola TaxID=1912599 RepID=A0ABV1LET0_9BURK
MERILIRMPFGMFACNLVAGIMIATSFPPLLWLLPVMVAASLVFCVFAAFFATSYTAYHTGIGILMRVTFCLFALALLETVAEIEALPSRTTWIAAVGYLILLSAVYLLYFNRERRAHWRDFAATLSSPTLVIENDRVRRIVRSRASSAGASSAYASIGAALGVAAVAVAGAMIGPHGKDTFQTTALLVVILSPLIFLRYMMAYFVSTAEVRRVEKQRNTRFAFDNVDELQRERATSGLARLLNPRLRQAARPSR